MNVLPNRSAPGRESPEGKAASDPLAFRDRLANLRRSWEEQRILRHVLNTHDWESRLELLLLIHEWAVAGCDEIRSVYPGLAAEAGPVPASDDRYAAFAVRVADAYTLTFRLEEARGDRWRVATDMAFVGDTRHPVAVGAPRAQGRWSRRRVEDLLLTLVAAYERGRPA